LHNQRHTYKATRPVTRWVHAFAKYSLIDYLRRSTADVEEGLPDDDALLGLGEEADAAETARRDLAKLLSARPPRCHLPVEHVKREGLVVQEAAAHTSISVSVAKIGIRRGLKVLARNLSLGPSAHG
jgi:RNA polymerase sigma-70 factor (ECF subfamily)